MYHHSSRRSYNMIWSGFSGKTKNKNKTEKREEYIPRNKSSIAICVCQTCRWVIINQLIKVNYNLVIYLCVWHNLHPNTSDSHPRHARGRAMDWRLGRVEIIFPFRRWKVLQKQASVLLFFFCYAEKGELGSIIKTYLGKMKFTGPIESRVLVRPGLNRIE